MEQLASSLRAANESRATVYRTLASLYFKELTEEQLERMKDLDFSAFSGLDGLFIEGCRDIQRFLRRKNTGTRQMLAVDFAGAILGAGVHEERRATPYESVFTSDNGLLMQDARDDVYRIFLEAHLEVDQRLRVPDDHLSFMFEYMAKMAQRCNEALAASAFDEAVELVKAQSEFHAGHLANWIDEYCDCLESCAETRFYRGVSKMTRSFVHLDEDLLAEMQDVVAKLAEEAPFATCAEGRGAS